ncbi:DUF3734 domain-containing protein [Bradyrhizobium barranii]
MRERLTNRPIELEPSRNPVQSRTRASTGPFKSLRRLQRELAALLSRLPEDLRQQEDVRLLRVDASHNVHSLVHLICRARYYEGHIMQTDTIRRRTTRQFVP